jgi:hypothetical protein
MVAVSEPYCRQLYKVSLTYDRKTLAATKVKPSTVIAAAYSPQPERWLKQAEVERLTEASVWRKTRAERNGHNSERARTLPRFRAELNRTHPSEEAPDGPSEQTVYARCREGGTAGWREMLPEPQIMAVSTATL